MTRELLDRDEAAQAGIAALQLLHDQAVGDAAQAGETVLGDARAEQIEGAHLGDEGQGSAAFAVMLLDDRLDLVIDERANRVAHHSLLFGEERIDIQKIDAWEAAQGGSSFGRLVVVWGGLGTAGQTADE